jgi:hypothetical protein
VTKTNRSTLRLFGCYYLDQNFDFFINWVPESPRFGLPKTSKQSLPAFTPSISGKTRGDGVKWLWYLDSASLNYPGTDTLVPAIELAEICVIEDFLEILFSKKIYHIPLGYIILNLFHSIFSLHEVRNEKYCFRWKFVKSMTVLHNFVSDFLYFSASWFEMFRKMWRKMEIVGSLET